MNKCPKRARFFRPLLLIGRDNKGLVTEKMAIEELIIRMGLSNAAVEEKMRSERTAFYYRRRWAISALKKAGLFEGDHEGDGKYDFEITQEGLQFLRDNRGEIEQWQVTRLYRPRR